MIEPSALGTGKAMMGVDSKHRRIHVVMPVDLVDAIDAKVGRRRRSQFIS
jgi:hypothetical protein